MKAELVYDIMGDGKEYSPQFPTIEDMEIDADLLIELGFEIETIRGKDRYVKYTLNDMFSMYSSPIEEGNLKVFPMWQVDPISESEVRLIVDVIDNIENRFGQKYEEE